MRGYASYIGEEVKSNSRNIKYFDCVLSAFGVGQIYGKTEMPPRPLAELLIEISNIVKNYPFLRHNRAGTENWHIADIDIQTNKKRAVLLINRSDKLAADQAISNPEDKEFLVAEKSETQGNAYSSHVVIALDPVAPNTYLTIVEEATGISSADIAVLLGMATRECSKVNPNFFLCNDASGAEDENGNLLRHRTRYRFDLRGHPSPDFINQLNGGKVHGMEVVAQSKNPVFWDGQAASVVEKKHVVHLKPELKCGTWFDLVKTVCATAKSKKMEAVRVIFTDAEDIRHTLEIDCKSLQILNEDRYVKKARIEDFTSRLDTACESILAEIRDKMFALI